MSWAKIDDQLHSNEKFLACSLAARGLWTICLSWVADKETDGAIPRSIVRLHAGLDLDVLTSELVEAGLWDVTEKGWAFHDYLVYNPSKTQLDEERQKAADRKAAWKERQQATRTSAEPVSDAGATHGLRQDSSRGNNTRTPAERRSVSVPNAERTEHPDPDPEVTKVTSSSPSPPSKATARRKADDDGDLPPGKLFDPKHPLPIPVQNFLDKSPNPSLWRERLLLELTGRELQCLDRYALKLLRDWKLAGGPPLPAPRREPRPTLTEAIAHVNHTVYQLVTEGDGF